MAIGSLSVSPSAPYPVTLAGSLISVTLVTGLAEAVRPQAPVAAAVVAFGGTDPLGATEVPGTAAGGAEGAAAAAAAADASAATWVVVPEASAGESSGEEWEHAPAATARATTTAAVTHRRPARCSS